MEKRRLEEARDFLQRFLEERGGILPKVALVLGSGLGGFGDTLEDGIAIPYEDIPHFHVPTVAGHKGRLIFGKVESVPVVCQQGRIHYYEGHSMEQVVFAVRLFALLGVKVAILTNAAGGVNPALRVGDFMLIRDHINFVGVNPLWGSHGREFGTPFVDLTEAYSSSLRSLARDVAHSLNIDLREGVYLACSGPSYETPAEIRMFRLLGADAVGMSTVMETVALRQLGVEVLALSCITNMAAGVSSTPLSHQEVIEVGKQVAQTFQSLIRRILQKIGEQH